MTNADGQLLRRWSIGYHPSMGDDQPVREWCCYASNSFEARVIAVQDCETIRTAELRMKTLQELVREMAETSEYYHSPNDENVAHA